MESLDGRVTPNPEQLVPWVKEIDFQTSEKVKAALNRGEPLSLALADVIQEEGEVLGRIMSATYHSSGAYKDTEHASIEEIKRIRKLLEEQNTALQILVGNTDMSLALLRFALNHHLDQAIQQSFLRDPSGIAFLEEELVSLPAKAKSKSDIDSLNNRMVGFQCGINRFRQLNYYFDRRN